MVWGVVREWENGIRRWSGCIMVWRMLVGECFLILIWFTYFMNLKKMMLQTMVTTQLAIHVVLTFPPLFLNYKYVFNWFGNNHIIINSGDCHLLLSTESPEVVSNDGIQILSSTAETLLGITIDLELNFENHLSATCSRVNRKSNALGRIANCISLEKRCIVMKTFIQSQFSYCPQIWMFHSRTINNKIKH